QPPALLRHTKVIFRPMSPATSCAAILSASWKRTWRRKPSVACSKKDVTEFDTLCGDADPEARIIFQAAITEHPADATHADASAGASSQRAPRDSLGVFGAPSTKDHYGWVAIGRRQSGSWVPNFTGYAISDTSLPPSGTVLSAKIMLPVWSEPQSGANDQSKLQSRLPRGACVRVSERLST